MYFEGTMQRLRTILNENQNRNRDITIVYLQKKNELKKNHSMFHPSDKHVNNNFMSKLCIPIVII